MRDLPVVKDLRARVTNETADQRPDQRALRLFYLFDYLPAPYLSFDQNFRIKMSAVIKIQKFP